MFKVTYTTEIGNKGSREFATEEEARTFATTIKERRGGTSRVNKPKTPKTAE